MTGSHWLSSLPHTTLTLLPSQIWVLVYPAAKPPPAGTPRGQNWFPVPARRAGRASLDPVPSRCGLGVVQADRETTARVLP